MLGKLLKYDLKSNFKILSIFYIIGIAFAIMTRFIFEFEQTVIIDIIGYLSIGGTIAMIFNILINNVMRLWVRFKQSLYGDESYLIHTLPVEKSSIYISKVLTSIVTMLVSILVIVLMLFIVYYSKDNVLFFKNLLDNMLRDLGTNYGIVISVLILLFLEFVNIVVVGFTGIMSGHRHNNNKVGYSILLGCIYYGVTQTILLGLILLLVLCNGELEILFQSFDTVDLISQKLLIDLIYTSTIFYSLAILIWSFIGTKVLKRGVNVD